MLIDEQTIFNLRVTKVERCRTTDVLISSYNEYNRRLIVVANRIDIAHIIRVPHSVKAMK